MKTAHGLIMREAVDCGRMKLRPLPTMMHHVDAGPGSQNRAIFECPKCGLNTGWMNGVTGDELQFGIQCPKCNDS